MLPILLALSLLTPMAAAPPSDTTSAVVTQGDDLQSKNFQVLPVCAPPAFGPWWIWADCILLGDHTAPQAVVVFDGVSLHLAAGASLDIDFEASLLWIGNGSRVLIGPGARID